MPRKKTAPAEDKMVQPASENKSALVRVRLLVSLGWAQPGEELAVSPKTAAIWLQKHYVEEV